MVTRRFPFHTLYRPTRRYYNSFHDMDPFHWFQSLMTQRFFRFMKQVAWFSVIAVGVGVSGMAISNVIKDAKEQELGWELFNQAVEIARNDERIQLEIGIPIKAFANDTTDLKLQNTLTMSKESKKGKEKVQIRFILVGPKGKIPVLVEGEDWKPIFINAELQGQALTLLDSRPPKTNYFRSLKFWESK